MSEKELAGVVTQKGQVTIPVEIRRLLGIGPRDRVIFSIEAGQVCLKAETETLESVYGAVTPLHRPEDFQSLRDQAIEEHAYRAIKEQDARYDIP
jgi:AbrB family looped-hinge helix DNA binding protein